MALDNFALRIKPAAGHTSPRDEVTTAAVLGTLSGCTVSLVDTGGGVMAWRFLNGSASSATPAAIAPLNLNSGSGDPGCTLVVRARVVADQFGVSDLHMFQLGGAAASFDGLVVSRVTATQADCTLNGVAIASHAGAASTTLRNYVLRIGPNSSGENDAVESWITTAGRSGTAPNAAATLSTRSGTSLNTLRIAPQANGYIVELHEAIFYRAAKSDAECAQLADVGADLQSLVAGDAEPPTLTGSITQGATTTTTMVVTWPAGADNVSVTGYEVSSNGGTSWVASNGATATTTSHTFSSLTASTAYAIRVRSKDAAGNVSTPALSASFSTSVPADTMLPTLTGSITQGATTTTTMVVTWPAGADNVAVTGYEVSSNGGTSWVASNGATATTTSHTFSSLTASTAYAIRVRAKDAAGNVSTPALSAGFSTSAPAAVYGFDLHTLPGCRLTSFAGSGAALNSEAGTQVVQIVRDIATAAEVCRSATLTADSNSRLPRWSHAALMGPGTEYSCEFMPLDGRTSYIKRLTTT